MDVRIDPLNQLRKRSLQLTCITSTISPGVVGLMTERTHALSFRISDVFLVNVLAVHILLGRDLVVRIARTFALRLLGLSILLFTLAFLVLPFLASTRNSFALLLGWLVLAFAVTSHNQ